MRFNQVQKSILDNMGFNKDDIKQIQDASTKTKFTYNSYYNERKISANKAIEYLGINDFLSGLSRSAFHFTAYIKLPSCSGVYFDSSDYFKEGNN